MQNVMQGSRPVSSDVVPGQEEEPMLRTERGGSGWAAPAPREPTCC